MSLASFDREVDDLRKRMEALIERARLSDAEEEILRTALEELSVSVEELQVASEEMQQQNEELLAARQTVEAERARYEALFDLAPDGYLVTDLYGLVQEANHAAARLVGVRQDRLLGKPLLSYVAEDDRDAFIRWLAFYREGGELGREPWEVRLQPRQREPFVASISMAPVRDAGGRPVGLRWMIRDVTGRVRREQQIAFQARALDQVGDAVIAVDEEERVTYLNRHAVQQYGVDAEAAIGRKLSELYEVEWPALQDEAAAYQALVERGYWRGQNVHIKRGGDRIWVESLFTVLEDADGQRTGVLASTRDITEQVRAQKERERLLAELDAERALLRAVFESAPEGMVVADAEARVLMTNPPADRIYARPVPYGDPYESHAQLEICHPDGTPYDPRELPLTRAALHGEVSEEVRMAIVWPDGQRRELLVNAAPIRSEADEVTGAVGVFQDVTDWVQVEEEREWLLEENRAQRQFLERLVETAPVRIAVVRVPDFRYEQVNARYRAIPGTSRVRMVGRTVAEVFPEAVAAGTIEFLERACRTGRTVTIHEYRASLGAGREETYWNVDHVPLHDAGGEVDRILIVAQEVTEQVVRRREIEAMAEAIGHERSVFDTVLENTFAELAYLDPEFNFIMVNSAYAEGSGHSREELIGRYHFDLFPNEENLAIFERVRDTGQAVSFQAKPFEYADQPERGTTYWDWMLVPVKDGEGEVQGLVFSLTDVTEQERDRLAVQRYADRLRVLHDADRAVLDARSPQQIAAAVLPHLRDSVPSRWAGVAMYDGEKERVSLLAADPDDGARAVDEQHAPVISAEAFAALARGEIHAVRDLAEATGPSPLTRAMQGRGVRAYVHVPMIAQGELIGALNIGLGEARELSEDETLIVREAADQLAIAIQQARLNEQVEAYAHELEEMVAERTEALRASEARLRAIFENAGIGIVLADLEGYILECNPTFERMVGYSDKALRGRHFRELTHPEDVEPDLALARELVSGQREGYQLEKRYLRADSGQFWGNLTVTGIADQAGRMRYLIGLIEDITERREVQEALIRSEKLNATGRLAASLAHEISNPLQSVIGCLGLAQEMLEEDAPVGSYIEIGLEELERASRIVGRLRDVARQSDEATRKPTQVGALLERTELLTRKHCQAHGVTLELAPLPEDLPEVEAVPDHLQQVLLNLILNAIEATPEGGSIEVRAERTDDPPGVSIFVIDTGNGIGPEVLQRLFEPFFTTKSTGTGLGLYVSRRIVESHGGHLSLDSAAGQGTTARVWLPA
jgi:PAS domain S-box-containing protein